MHQASGSDERKVERNHRPNPTDSVLLFPSTPRSPDTQIWAAGWSLSESEKMEIKLHPQAPLSRTARTGSAPTTWSTIASSAVPLPSGSITVRMWIFGSRASPHREGANFLPSYPIYTPFGVGRFKWAKATAVAAISAYNSHFPISFPYRVEQLVSPSIFWFANTFTWCRTLLLNPSRLARLKWSVSTINCRFVGTIDWNPFRVGLQLREGAIFRHLWSDCCWLAHREQHNYRYTSGQLPSFELFVPVCGFGHGGMRIIFCTYYYKSVVPQHMLNLQAVSFAAVCMIFLRNVNEIYFC